MVLPAKYRALTSLELILYCYNCLCFFLYKVALNVISFTAQVVGLARRQDRLDAISNTLVNKKGQFYAYRVDVTKEDDLVDAFSWINKNVGPIHILVNNAGVFRRMEVSHFTTEDAKTIFDTNVIALSIATREALKYFKENNVKGHIINMNSVAGHCVHNLSIIAGYTASKYAVTALSEAAYLEMKRLKLGTKITVSISN